MDMLPEDVLDCVGCVLETPASMRRTLLLCFIHGFKVGL